MLFSCGKMVSAFIAQGPFPLTKLGTWSVPSDLPGPLSFTWMHYRVLCGDREAIEAKARFLIE